LRQFFSWVASLAVRGSRDGTVDLVWFSDNRNV
jgi:hypothetical protein